MKSIGCFYHYCKSLWVYAKKHNCFIKKNNKELFFFLFPYKIYPFIKNKDIYLQQIELIINKSNNKIRYLKLHKYFVKNWSKQKLLNYNEYFDNKFYDTTNNFSEAFNYALHRLINTNHPKISTPVDKLKTYIKLRINDYYEYIKKNINTNSTYEINKKGEISKTRPGAASAWPGLRPDGLNSKLSQNGNNIDILIIFIFIMFYSMLLLFLKI